MEPLSALAAPSQPTLVLVQLVGGNDALNTLVPYQDPLYRKLRPNLALSEKSLLNLDSRWALHPSLKGTRSLFEQGQLKFFPGVGRPDHDRSHFRSSDLWHTAGDVHQEEGWLAKLARLRGCEAVNIADQPGRSLFSAHHPSYHFREELPDPNSQHPKLWKELVKLYGQLPDSRNTFRALRNSATMLEKLTGEYQKRLRSAKLPTQFPDHATGKRFELLGAFSGCRPAPSLVPSGSRRLRYPR